jgi:hypothetical protein
MTMIMIIMNMYCVSRLYAKFGLLLNVNFFVFLFSLLFIWPFFIQNFKKKGRNSLIKIIFNIKTEKV